MNRYDHDVCVQSPTGSGKTYAYAIPIIKVLDTKHKYILIFFYLEASQKAYNKSSGINCATNT